MTTEPTTDNVQAAFRTLGPKFQEPRPIQSDLLEQLDRDRPHIALVEAPVGIGKSGIAVAYGEMLPPFESISHPADLEGELPDPAVFLTATISLQEQYARDFDNMALVKGRGNFECTLNDLSAAEGVCTVEQGTTCSSEYYDQRAEALRSGRIVANYPVYLYEQFYAGSFLGLAQYKQRPRLLVCDEAHRLLDQLTEFEKVKLDSRLAERLGVGPEECGWDSLREASLWASEHKRNIDYHWRQAVNAGRKNAKLWLALKRQVDSIATVGDDYHELKAGEVVEAAPLWPERTAKRLFEWPRHVLLMSATMYGGHLLADLLGVLDPFSGSLEVPYGLYTAPSPFDPNRWPVYYAPIASLTYRSSDQDWRAMVDKCHEYMHEMPTTRGVIHITAAKQVQHFTERLSECHACFDRLHFPIQGIKRAETLDEFRHAGEGAWLLHYSVGEGESFDDDSARIQLIAKTPYPDLSDKLTKLRMDEGPRGKKMYAALTLGKVAQIAGRVMRHENDYGQTVILDGTFSRLWSWNKTLAPAWFHDILRT